MKIYTTYDNSISFTPNMEKRMRKAGSIDVYHKYTKRYIATIDAVDALLGGKQLPIKDRLGNVKMSFYKVYNF